MEIKSEIMRFVRNVLDEWNPYEIKRIPKEHGLKCIQYVAARLGKDVIGVVVDDEERMILLPNPFKNTCRMFIINHSGSPLACMIMSDPMIALPTQMLNYYAKEYAYEREKLSYDIVPVVSGPNKYELEQLGDDHAR